MGDPLLQKRSTLFSIFFFKDVFLHLHFSPSSSFPTYHAASCVVLFSDAAGRQNESVRGEVVPSSSTSPEAGTATARLGWAITTAAERTREYKT